jgi:hypothetical protein
LSVIPERFHRKIVGIAKTLDHFRLKRIDMKEAFADHEDHHSRSLFWVGMVRSSSRRQLKLLKWLISRLCSPAGMAQDTAI